jgi:flavin-dependent dehydrogenase
MKVAIIGAGISGLAAAFEFKRHNITPVIFEKKSHIGNPVLFTSATLHIFNHFMSDPFCYLKKNYGLNISPTFQLKKLIMSSPQNKAVIKGNLGYIVNRMREEGSLANQLFSKVALPIEFNSFVDINDIKEAFDYIIVATGSNLIAKDLNLWTNTFSAQIRSATIVGNFDTQSVLMWLNKDYAKDGFGYLIPTRPKEATLNLAVNNITFHEIDYYWENFLYREDLNYKIIETRDASFECGFLSTHQLDNLYFTGNTAGFTDSLIGFGQIKAIESGILAARAIVNNLDYNKLVTPIARDMLKINEFRKILNSFSNKDLDKLLSFLKLPVIKQLIYNNPFFKIKYGTFIAKLYNKFINN